MPPSTVHPSPNADPPFADAWSGRRDLIPPPDDQLTHQIDLELVAGGYLSPEELDEIHRVGLEMTASGPTLRRIGSKPRSWASRCRGRPRGKSRIKAMKRAEAAELKRVHDEDVAHRKATDIEFLGRGVSKFLGDRVSDLPALEAAGLPPLSTPSELAEALGLSISRLRWLAFHAEAATRVHYVTFEVRKKSGGSRKLSAPHRSLASAQRWVLDRVVGMIPCEAEAHGFVAGRSILTNASPHSGQAVVVNLDLKDFFPSIGFRRVRSVFRRVGYSPARGHDSGASLHREPATNGGLRRHNLPRRHRPEGAPSGGEHQPRAVEPRRQKARPQARRLSRKLGRIIRGMPTTSRSRATTLEVEGRLPDGPGPPTSPRPRGSP